MPPDLARQERTEVLPREPLAPPAMLSPSGIRKAVGVMRETHPDLAGRRRREAASRSPQPNGHMLVFDERSVRN